MNPGFLEGVRVLELGDGVAGGAACGLLAALGADVTAAVDPDSVHRHGRPSVGAPGTSLLALCLDRGKRLVELDDETDLEDLLGQGFDVIVVDRVAGARGPLASTSALGDHLALVERHQVPAWVTISAFGLSGPRAGDVATELTVAAASGMLSAVRDAATGRPLKLGGQQSLLNTGQAAALAACHALDLRSAGDPVHLDLSAVEATLAMGPVLEVGGELLATASVGGAKRYGAPASYYPCIDGLVRISAMEDHQWQGVVAAMGSPAWTERFATVEARIAAPDDIDAEVGEWTRTLTKLEAETVLQRHGVPATAVSSPSEVLRSPQLAHRGAFEPLDLGDGRCATVVGLPFDLVGGNDPARRRRRSLRGLRVLDASRVLAVPLAGSLLGALGARVNKLEDLARIDMYRRRGPYVDGEPGAERSAYFALMNHSKGSIAFDVDADRARLDEVLDSVDVVLENLGHKRATALGMAASASPTIRPDVLAVSSSGFGQDGPHARYRAYAYNLHASGALGFLTRNEQGESAEIDIAWADLISAYALATIVAAWAVGPEGNAGVGVDFSMTDLVVAHFNEYLAAASIDDDDADRANELAPWCPNGVYPVSDGWIAISANGEEEQGRLAVVLSLDPALVGDVARRREVDVLISEATRRHDGGALARELRNAGIAAEAVLGAPELVTDPHLVDREVFAPVRHPEWGERKIVGIPWRREGGAPIALGPPPLLGASR